MVSQVPVDRELCIGVDSIENKDGDSSLPLPLEDHNAPNIPVKKQTRQWAAWTRQEEESFFAALRQVGKNFEKITSRIQSKNKDQVRHYYYRLVRRMNKLLGPELSLDAKNSKDTIAAMLRWWSLLEKYSCKASKLHLKPRRFKIFVETLENQLLKDRKKNIKKRLSTGENNSSVANIPAPNQSRVSGHEDRGAKMALVDSQNIQKVGTGKGSLLKRNVNIGMKRTNCKADPTSGKAAKQRRKAGLISTTAYKRWEEAAIAGVSLVADAAEHLERVDTDKEIEHAQETLGPDGVRDVDKVVQSLPASQSTLDQNNLQNAKLKLQLFPIDECTQKALEMGNHNPHLELTLSTRKKISSVVEHLNRKWGNSSLLCQEMMLFPYWAQTENLVGYQRWTKDSPLCAADVYNLIGSPPIFRLRYGWFSVAEIESATAQALSCSNQEEQNLNINIEKEQSAETEKPSGLQDDQFVSSEQISAALISPSTLATRSNGFASAVSNMVRETGASAVARHVENAKDIRLSGGDWADSLTSISMGDLLSESAQNMDVNCAESPVTVATNCFQQLPFTCDSFDAAIAAHIYKHHNKVGLQQGFASHGPSIWDAEETCDAFAFHKSSAFSKEGSNSLEAVKLTTCSPLAPQKEIEELNPVEKSTDVSTCGGQMDYARPVHSSEEPTKDYGGLTDMYWPDSLGPLDFDIPSSSRYHSNDLILSDSLGGLNRVMASSLDAFQNCSFLGYDKKEGASTVESHQSASFSDFKVSGEV